MYIALFSFLGIVVGAALQYLFTKVLEEKRHKRDLKTQAYTDYLRAISEVKHLMIQPLAKKEREMFARVTDAKARICLYGDDVVLKRLAEFERLGGLIKEEEQVRSFTAILDAMRGSSDVSVPDLEVIILGNKYR